MITTVTYREYSTALWVSATFVLVSVLDGFLKIQLIQGPLIYFWFFDVAKWLLLPILLMFAVHRASNIHTRDYGLVADLGVTDILTVLPAPFIVLLLVNFLTEGFANVLFGWPKPPFSHRETLAPLGPLWIVGTFYFSITAGLWESIFYIGLPWLWFSQGRRVEPSRVSEFYFVSALLFAVSHWENGLPNVVGALTFQWCAIWWYLRLRTLWPVIGAHALIDVYYFWPA